MTYNTVQQHRRSQLSRVAQVTLLISSILLLNACGVRKPSPHSAAHTTSSGVSQSAFVDHYEQRQSLPSLIESRGSMMIQSGDSRASVRYRMLMAPHDYLELSIRPMGLIEVAKVYITDHDMMIANKLDRTLYWGDFAAIRDSLQSTATGLHPELFWALIQNAPFDDTQYGSTVLRSMQMVWRGTHAVFSKESGEVEIEHIIDGESYQLLESSVRHSSGAQIQISYKHFEPISSAEGAPAYPHQIRLDMVTPHNIPSRGNIPETIIIRMDDLESATSGYQRADREQYEANGYRVVPIHQWITKGIGL